VRQRGRFSLSHYATGGRFSLSHYTAIFSMRQGDGSRCRTIRQFSPITRGPLSLLHEITTEGRHTTERNIRSRCPQQQLFGRRFMASIMRQREPSPLSHGIDYATARTVPFVASPLSHSPHVRECDSENRPFCRTPLSH
jgi:hypothetical protein